jgi:hypothetical protein
MKRISTALWILTALAATATSAIGCKGPPPTNPAVIAREPNRLLWGDTHVHTSYSADARQPGRRAVDPNTAYRWAKGLPVVHPETRARIQLQRPLDFLAVTDHAEALGQTEWNELLDTAERHYAPCSFTTFIGWEWTAELGSGPIHRVVLMNGGAEKAGTLTPFSALEGGRPEDLWRWLDETSHRVEADFIAVPHIPDLGDVVMAPKQNGEEHAMTATDAEARMRWERLAEVIQIEGDSEAEARTALLRGLQIAQAVGVNPFQFAMIGSTGSHTGIASADEAYFWGAAPGLAGRDANAQGLIGVWAEENTRASIFDAFERKEVYATTGPRIRVRFFGGWAFEAKQAQKANMVTLGYTFGHPMGSNLKGAPDGKVPSFLMYAVKDPEDANLDRIELVKGWVDAEGNAHEEVYDVAWSAGRERGADGELPPVNNSVDLATASYENADGAAALRGFWSDPAFDPEQHAFYYLRVLQIPTPRHSLYDAVANQVDPSESGQPTTIQERAYTSPIWYSP